MTYERNRFNTQRNFLHQGRHHRDVGFGNGNSRGRSMIYRTPEPRLEPNHHYNDYINNDDDEDTDFIQPIDDDVDLTPYYWEEGELKDLVKREPQCHIV